MFVHVCSSLCSMALLGRDGHKETLNALLVIRLDIALFEPKVVIVSAGSIAYHVDLS